MLNNEMHRRSVLAPMANILIECNLRWTGHIYWIDAEGPPRQLICLQQSSGTRNQKLKLERH